MALLTENLLMQEFALNVFINYKVYLNKAFFRALKASDV